MRRNQLIARVRSLTRDFSNSIFREQDIIDFINEGIGRFKQIIPEFSGMERLLVQEQEPTLIPEHYHHLLAIYATSRCFGQDERHYQATTYMNEFETKLDELKESIMNGDIVITDPDTGLPMEVGMNAIDYVNLEPYWGIKKKPIGFDVVGDD